MSVKVIVTESDVVNQNSNQGIPGANAPTSASGALSVKSAKTMAAGAVLGKGVANYAISNVGKYTGSSQTQNKVNNGMEIAGMAMMMYINPALGVANMALKIATAAMDEIYRRKWETIELDQAKARAGYTPETYSKGH